MSPELSPKIEQPNLKRLRFEAFKREMRILFEIPKTDEERQEINRRRENVESSLGHGGISIWP